MTAPQKIVGLFFYLKVTQKHTSVVQGWLEYCIIKNMLVDGSTVYASDPMTPNRWKKEENIYEEYYR